MSKYDPLWTWIKDNGTDSFLLTFDEISNAVGKWGCLKEKSGEDTHAAYWTDGEDYVTVTFRNRDGRFYALDTVKAPIPALPDGAYDVYSEEYGGRSSYVKQTLSLAARRQGDDYAIYVADYRTGEPVSSATVRLKYGRRLNKVLEREIPLNTQGFTPLPTDFRKQSSFPSRRTRLSLRRRRSMPAFSRSGARTVPVTRSRPRPSCSRATCMIR